MAIVLALSAAVSWGISDFMGGLAGRRVAHDISVAVSMGATLIGLLGLTIIATLVGGDAMSPSTLLYSAAAGVGGAIGIALLYRGLTIAKMGVVAPITGAGAAALPVLFGGVQGEVPSPLGWVGIGVAIVSIVLVSREPAATDAPVSPVERGRRDVMAPGVKEGIGAGVGFGLLFILLDQTPESAALWPLVPMKASAAVLLGAVGLVSAQPLVPPRPVWPHVAVVGLLDNAANVGYLLATRAGLLALVAVVSSLYPAFTVLCARFVLQERLARHQFAGLVLAVVAVVLISLS